MKPGPEQASVSAAMLQWFHDHDGRGILTTDVELRIRRWNSWLATATGLSEEAVLGEPLLDVFPSLAERGIDQYYMEALSGHVKILSHSLHRYILPTAPAESPAEQMPQRGQIAPLTAADGIVGTVTIVEDVSERVASERELRARIAAAERARTTAENASRVKDEFLATLSHEIRTPLNAVLGWTRILRSRGYDRATVERAMEVIDRNASAQLTLISDMLDMARIAAGKVRLEVRDLELAPLALAAMDVVKPAADAKGVRLVTDFAAVPMVKGDHDRLLQVVWNLLSNAVKFTDSGGTVTTAIRGDDRVVQLIVTDTGQGIPREFLPQVFERFKQADSSSARRHGGLGLGLALVRELVELHGGIVNADSPGPGHGSSFVVQLPAAEHVRLPSNAPASVATTSLAGMHVLIVEDDDDGREIIVQALEDAGATVSAVSGARDALALLCGAEPTTIQVVVTDIGMPEEDGYTLLRELRQLPVDQGGDLPAIAVTSYATVEDRRRALKAGFVAHIGKPFSPMTLVATIARAVTGRTRT